MIELTIKLKESDWPAGYVVKKYDCKSYKIGDLKKRAWITLENGDKVYLESPRYRFLSIESVSPSWWQRMMEKYKENENE